MVIFCAILKRFMYWEVTWRQLANSTFRTRPWKNRKEGLVKGDSVEVYTLPGTQTCFQLAQVFTAHRHVFLCQRKLWTKFQSICKRLVEEKVTKVHTWLFDFLWFFKESGSLQRLDQTFVIGFSRVWSTANFDQTPPLRICKGLDSKLR